MAGRKIWLRVKHPFGIPQRIVENGRVWCPKSGDVTVEECLHCSRLVEADLAADPPFVSCTAPDEDLRHIIPGANLLTNRPTRR